MELIQTTTVGAGGAANITFSSIPATYDDLLLVVSGRTDNIPTNGGHVFWPYFNGSTTNPTGRRLMVDNGTVRSASDFGAWNAVAASTYTANTFGNTSIYIPNYTVSGVAKSFSTDGVAENNATEATLGITAGVSEITAAITSIRIAPPASINWVEHTSASLYGIRKFNTTTQPKATGGAISYDAVNQKWVHVFTASGTFTPTQNLTGVEYLVVAGGGSGGGYLGGGGGAGGYRSSVIGELSGGGASAEATLSLTSGSTQTVTVGAGGASVNGLNVRGIQGSSSAFGSISTVGGGSGGGSNSTPNGGNGGSGGGAGNSPTSGTGTAGQGFRGGNNASAFTSCSGGGGAGGQGIDAFAEQVNTAGGPGLASSITGSSVARAGGGGGGSATGITAQFQIPGGGSFGGGGAGGVAPSGAGTNGAISTGSGGGGPGGNGFSGATGPSGAGGSGIVIVRYS